MVEEQRGPAENWQAFSIRKLFWSLSRSLFDARMSNRGNILQGWSQNMLRDFLNLVLSIGRWDRGIHSS
jgi:hypothetical protein